MSRAMQDQTRVRTGTVDAVELVQHRFLPIGVDLENRAVVPVVAAARGTVEVAGRIHCETGSWTAAVGATQERVEHGLNAGRVQLEHGATAAPPPSRASQVAAIRGDTVETVRTIQNQTCRRIRTVGSAFERVENGQVARGVQLENTSASIETGKFASVVRGAIQVAGGILDQVRLRVGTVLTAFEAVENGFFAARIQLEDSAAASKV